MAGIFTTIGLLLTTIAALFGVGVTLALVGDGFITLWSNDYAPTWEKAGITAGWIVGLAALVLLAVTFG